MPVLFEHNRYSPPQPPARLHSFSGPYPYVLFEDGSIKTTDSNGGDNALTVPVTPDGRKATAPGNKSFRFSPRPTGITLPEGITAVGGQTFFSCGNPESISLPQGLTSNGDPAFAGCSKLTTLTLPDSLTFIHSRAFSKNTGLTLTVPRDSYASRYAIDNGFRYTYPARRVG